MQNSQFTIFHKCSKSIADHKFPNTATVHKNVLTADEAHKIWLQKEKGGIKNIVFVNRTDYKLSTRGTNISDFQNTLAQQKNVFTHLMPDDASLLFTLPFTSSWQPLTFRYFKGSLLHQCFQSQRDNFPRLEIIDVEWNQPEKLIAVYDRTQILENMSFHLHVRRPSGFIFCDDKIWNFDFWLFKTIIHSHYPNDLSHFKSALSSEFGIVYDSLLMEHNDSFGVTQHKHMYDVYTKNSHAQSHRDQETSCVEMERKEKSVWNKFQTEYIQKLETTVKVLFFLIFEDKNDDSSHQKNSDNLLYDSHSKQDVDRVLKTLTFKCRNQSTDAVVNPLTNLCERTKEFDVIDLTNNPDPQENVPVPESIPPLFEEAFTFANLILPNNGSV